MKSCLYEGRVRHRRHGPVDHGFAYDVFQVYLDLDELDEVFRGRLLWSARRPAVAWFRRADHLGDPAVPLDAAVRDLVEERLGRRPDGPVRLLTHLRYFGYCMNPVSFFYCYGRDAEGAETLEAIVAEIHNTPWGERYCYVVDARRAADDPEGTNDAGTWLRFRFAKAFHVSPFMPMDQEYAWRFLPPDDRLAVHMENRAGDRSAFDVTMVLHRTPMTGTALARVLLRYPLMTWKVIVAIYWQALRLKLKGVAFHPHPKHRLAAEGASR